MTSTDVKPPRELSRTLAMASQGSKDLFCPCIGLDATPLLAASVFFNFIIFLKSRTFVIMRKC